MNNDLFPFIFRNPKVFVHQQKKKKTKRWYYKVVVHEMKGNDKRLTALKDNLEKLCYVAEKKKLH